MKHVHDFKLEDEGVLGIYQKGNREKYYAIGDYERCTCKKGRFVPWLKELRTVECEKTVWVPRKSKKKHFSS